MKKTRVYVAFAATPPDPLTRLSQHRPLGLISAPTKANALNQAREHWPGVAYVKAARKLWCFDQRTGKLRINTAELKGGAQ